MKNVEMRKRRGFITHEDIIRLTKLQTDLFPDYAYLDRCIEAQLEAVRTRTQPQPYRELESAKPDKIYADNEMIPLSFSGIVNPQKTIVFKERSL